MEANKTLRIKTRWEQHKNATRCLEQKNTTVIPPTSYLTNNSSRTNKTCEPLLEK